MTRGRAFRQTCRSSLKPPRMSDEEKRLVREMHADRNMSPVQIARTVGRNISSITCLPQQEGAPKKMGRPVKFAEHQGDKVVKTLETMIDEADATQEVTLQRVMHRCRDKVCERTVADALHARGHRFQRLRSKMILTPEDIKHRSFAAAVDVCV